MPFRKSLLILLVILASLTLFSLISAQSDQPLPLPSGSDTGSAEFQGRSAIELLTNTSFEVDLDGDKLPDDWKAKNTDVTKSDKLKCNKPEKLVAYTGNCAFQFSGNPTGEESRLSQKIAAVESIVNGSTLTLSAYVDPKSGIADSKIASLKVKLSDSSKLKLNLRLSSDARTSGYVQLTDMLPVVIPVGAVITEAKLDLKYGETSGKYLIDDVSLSVSTPVTITETSTSIPIHTATPEPTTELITHLFANDPGYYDGFGNQVLLSDDGNTALISAPWDSTDAIVSHGSAYIFVRTGTGWVQQAKLLADDGVTFDKFGRAISLSGDGNTAAIGAFSESGSPNPIKRSVYIFTRSGDVWTLKEQLTATGAEAINDFGISVSLSDDGHTLLIGASEDPAFQNGVKGSAYIYVRQNDSWILQQQLLAGDGEFDDRFGHSVSLSGDGRTALIGAHNDVIGLNGNVGSAYIYTFNEGQWTEQQKLTASDGSYNDRFGIVVRLSGDGKTALISATWHDVDGYHEQGAVYAYILSNDLWVENQQIVASEPGNGGFGSLMSLNHHGNLAIITGQFVVTDPDARRKTTLVYVKGETGWVRREYLFPLDPEYREYVTSNHGLNADGSMAIVGLGGDNMGENYINQGSALIFSVLPKPPAATATPTHTPTATSIATSTPSPEPSSTYTSTVTPTRTPSQGSTQPPSGGGE